MWCERASLSSSSIIMAARRAAACHVAVVGTVRMLYGQIGADWEFMVILQRRL